MIEINCKLFKEKHAKLFGICGFTHCIKKPYEFWKHVPEKEYFLWIASILSPLSTLTFNERHNYCWSGFMKLVVDFSQPIENAVEEPEGFKVRVYGSSNETKGATKCGNLVVSDLIPGPFNVRTSHLFKVVLKMLNDMGYVSGLTYQVVPYDFRLPLKHNQLTSAFKANIFRLNQLTRKKVAILGHSFGNNNIYTELLNLDQKFKDETVKVWIAVGAALTGVLKSLKVLLNGDPEFMIANRTFGLRYKPAAQAFNSMFPIYDLLPINPFDSYKGQDWFKAVEKRMQYEDGKIPYEESGFAFLPKITDKCSPDNFSAFKPDCRLGLYNETNRYVFKVKQDEYKLEDIEKLISKYDFTGNQHSYYNITRSDTIIKATNPGVPLVTITLRTVETPNQYRYDKDLWDFYKNDKYGDPEVTTGYGDGTITSNSLFILALKWAYEHDNGTTGAKPVKIIDMCSTYNVKYNVYDKTDNDSAYEIERNEFMGIECECMKDKVPKRCVHEFMIQDQMVLKLYHQTLITNEVTYNDDYNRFVDSLDDKDLLNMVTLCPQIIYDMEYKVGSGVEYTADEI